MSKAPKSSHRLNGSARAGPRIASVSIIKLLYNRNE
jgi:hypothetical protein